mmetsp:Transcript_3682/g.9412  ORF Transcript_3682/g.9412 Transcript_3682/m.9412 type:complete len:241 (-) Transcript_3682:182-904(-)
MPPSTGYTRSLILPSGYHQRPAVSTPDALRMSCPTVVKATSSGDSVDFLERKWFLDPHSYVKAFMPPWNVTIYWKRCLRNSSLTTRAVCVCMHFWGCCKYGKSRFGSMPFSSRVLCAKPAALVIGVIHTLRVSTRWRISSFPALYCSHKNPASSVTTRGPTRSFPWSAPLKNTSGVAAVKRRLVPMRTMRVWHGLPTHVPQLSRRGKISGNKSCAIHNATMSGYSRSRRPKYAIVSTYVL